MITRPWAWLAILSLWLLVACGDNKLGTVGVTALQLSPAAPTVAAGGSVQITATAVLANDTTRDVTSEAAWSTSDTAVATVDASGNVTGVASGTAQIAASFEGVQASVTVTVTSGALVAVEVTPTNPSIPLGIEQQLMATGRFADDTTMDLTDQVTWTVDNANVTVDAAGLATAAAVGTSTVTATFDGVSGSTTVTVTAALLVAIDITPAAPTLAKGTTAQLTATGRFSDASTEDLTGQVTWAADMLVATVDVSGLATAVDIGTTTVTATLDNVQGTTTLTVTEAMLVSIAVTPSMPTIPVGVTQQMMATGTFTDNTTQDLTATAVWASSVEATATISNAAGTVGLLSTVANGSTTITATVGAISGSTDVTVSGAALVSIAVTPVNPSLADGLTEQFTAVGTFSDNTTQDLTTQVTWTSSDAAVAAISNASGSQGLATAIDPGTTTITATSGSVSGTTTLTVTAATLVSLAITPANPQLARGLSLPFTATGTFTDNSTQDVTTQVTWVSSDTAIASISNAVGSEGVATALELGTVTITATLNSVSATTMLEVTAATLVSIRITPENPTFDEGTTQQLVATGTFSDSTTSDLTTQVTWASADTNIVTVSNAAGSEGLATGIAAGSAQVTATMGSVTGATTATITGVPPTVIATTPDAGATNVFPTTTISITFSRPMQAASLTAQATVGACTGSIQVSLDNFASCIGLSAPALSPTGTVATTTPAPALALSTTYQIRVTTAATSASGIAMASAFTQTPGFTTEADAPCVNHLVISQVYGGGGANTGTPAFNRDFVEIHNPTTATVALGGSLQYASATGTGNWTVAALPTVDIPAGGYFLVALGTTGTAGAAIPIATDASFTNINMSATAGKIALVGDTVQLNGACPTSAAIVDLVGYGATANCAEGTSTATLTNATAVLRRRDGNRDSGNNANDFQVGTPAPRNSATAANVCAASVNETDVAGELDFCVLQFPAATTTASGAMSEMIFARVFEAGVTETPGAQATVRAQIGYGPASTNPQAESGWTWLDAAFNLQVGNDDEYQLQLTAPAAGSYRYTARFSTDGLAWTYCDLDGAGSNAGLTFEPSELGVWTVN